MLDAIKRLRDRTSLGIKDCKKALEEAQGNFDKALQLLKERGIHMLEKKSSRQTSQGLIESYVHFGGNLGVLVEVNCETDFVARTEVFKQFVKDVAMHIAAAAPTYLSREDIPEETKENIKNLDEFAQQHCLMDQAFVKDSKVTIAEYLREVVSQTGENIVINRFVRFSLGETNEA